VTIQLKAIEQNLQVTLFIMLYKVVLALKLVDETLLCEIQMKAIEPYFHLVHLKRFKSLDETLKAGFH